MTVEDRNCIFGQKKNKQTNKQTNNQKNTAVAERVDAEKSQMVPSAS